MAPETYAGPFALPLMDRGNLLHTRDLAALISAPGEDRAKVAMEVRGLVSRGYINPVGRDRNDARGALLFAPDAALVVAAVRAAATDVGVAGKDRLRRIADALQLGLSFNRAEDEPRNAAAFILMTAMGDRRAHGFSVELHSSRHIDLGCVHLAAAVRHDDHGFIERDGTPVVLVPEAYMPTGAVVVPLDDLADRIVGGLHKRRAN